MMQLFTLRNVLVVTAVGLAAAFAYETDWGDAFSASPVALRQTAARQDSAAVLPDFRLSSESNAYSQITERPLLNPSRKPAPTQAIHVLIGPESGLDAREIELAMHTGFKPTLLGTRILRTETAGLATISALQTLWGDF